MSTLQKTRPNPTPKIVKVELKNFFTFEITIESEELKEAFYKRIGFDSYQVYYYKHYLFFYSWNHKCSYSVKTKKGRSKDNNQFIIQLDNYSSAPIRSWDDFQSMIGVVNIDKLQLLMSITKRKLKQQIMSALRTQLNVKKDSEVFLYFTIMRLDLHIKAVNDAINKTNKHIRDIKPMLDAHNLTINRIPRVTTYLKNID